MRPNRRQASGAVFAIGPDLTKDGSRRRRLMMIARTVTRESNSNPPEGVAEKRARAPARPPLLPYLSAPHARARKPVGRCSPLAESMTPIGPCGNSTYPTPAAARARVADRARFTSRTAGVHRTARRDRKSSRFRHASLRWGCRRSPSSGLGFQAGERRRARSAREVEQPARRSPRSVFFRDQSPEAALPAGAPWRAVARPNTT